MVYTSSSIALAALEILVNLDSTATLLERHCVIRVEIPARASVVEVESIRDLDVPVTIDDIVAWPARAATRAIGDAWCSASSSLALSVPSAVVPQERNILINPRHAEFGMVTVGSPVPFRGLLRCAGGGGGPTTA